jgi:opacity protein-like surface antigen
MKKTIAAAVALAAALAAGDAAAQTPLPLSLELRAGAAFPQGDIEDVSTGYTFGASAAYGFAPGLEGYLSYSQAVYSPDGGDAEDADAKLRDKGFGLGLRYSFPLPGRVRPWVSAGVARRQMEVDTEDGNITFENEIGYEAGAGVAFDVSPKVSITPGIGYTSFTIDGEEFDSEDAKLGSIRLDVGVRVRL